MNNANDTDMRPAHVFLVGLIAALLWLAAFAAFAQTGDCALESGTTTTWEVLDPASTRPTILYTFYDAGLANVPTDEYRPRGAPDIVAAADNRCPVIDRNREQTEIGAALLLVRGNPDAETVQPAYPEVCPPVAPAENAADCRRSRFHAFIAEWAWPQDTLVLVDYFYEIFDWSNTPKSQGGAGFNPGQRVSWFGVETAENWSEQRMNNIGAVVSAIRLDRQNHGGEQLDPVKP